MSFLGSLGSFIRTNWHADFQWAPTLTSHDPSDVITLEDPAGVVEVTGAGGAVTAGAATVSKLSVVTGANGAVTAGTAAVSKLSVVTMSGGIVMDGSPMYADVDEYIGIGGIVINGTAPNFQLQPFAAFRPGSASSNSRLDSKLHAEDSDSKLLTRITDSRTNFQ